jgi:phosphohistidine swiveling domain-containing protein
VTLTSHWQGRGASPGVAQGLAHVIRTDHDLDDVLPGRILLSRHATPELLPALIRASAAVCETGGLFCHLAVLARELGKPCVTGVAGIVDATETGDSLRVDGGRGVVDTSSRDRNDPKGVPAVTAVDDPRPAKVPVLQFGQFSAAFQCVRASIDVEMAVRIAAIISLPRTFGLGSAWNFEIVGNQVLVDLESLDSSVNVLVGRLEIGLLPADEIRRRYEELCGSKVWSAVANGGAHARVLDAALRHYVELNQLTWAAIVAKEPLVHRYRRFLSKRLPRVDPVWLQEQFLDTIVLPGHSYILRLWRDHHRAPVAGPPAEPRARAGAADRRRDAALDQLERRVDGEDLGAMRRYLAALEALVELAERKNIDLVRCGRALFGTDENRRAVARRLGISQHERPNDPQVGQRIIRQIAGRLCNGTF